MPNVISIMSIQGSSQQSKAEVQAEKTGFRRPASASQRFFGIFDILEICLEMLNFQADLYICGGLCGRGYRWLLKQKDFSEIDGASWMVYCKSRRKVVFKGSFYEWCATAGSYRGELLGLLVVHLLVMAVEIFYDLRVGSRGLVACDNLGGLNKSR